MASLPVADSLRRPERADATRNRRRVLEAAQRLFAAGGVEAVSMDAVARAAGVGKGTLYRRFGDRAGLAMALLDDRERALQETVLRGAPPLGPGADPGERLVAFVRALVAHADRHGTLMQWGEESASGARFRGPVYGWRRQHVALLLETGGLGSVPGLPDVVLAPLSAAVVRQLRDGLGLSAEEAADASALVARRLLRPDG